jgi:hypothetical protein
VTETAFAGEATAACTGADADVAGADADTDDEDAGTDGTDDDTDGTDADAGGADADAGGADADAGGADADAAGADGDDEDAVAAEVAGRDGALFSRSCVRSSAFTRAAAVRACGDFGYSSWKARKSATLLLFRMVAQRRSSSATDATRGGASAAGIFAGRAGSFPCPAVGDAFVGTGSLDGCSAAGDAGTLSVRATEAGGELGDGATEGLAGACGSSGFSALPTIGAGAVFVAASCTGEVGGGRSSIAAPGAFACETTAGDGARVRSITAKATTATTATAMATSTGGRGASVRQGGAAL